ncbi:MAG: HAMP domain-containing sensor histidine kinase [Bacteroidota bacterium]
MLKKFRTWIPALLFLCGVIFMLLAFYLPSFYNPKNELHIAAVSTESTIASFEKQFQVYYNKLKTDGNALTRKDSDKSLLDAPFTLLYFVNDSIAYWNNNKILPGRFDSIPQEGIDFQKYKNGYYVTVYRLVENSAQRKRALIMYLSVRDAYVTENQYLKHEYSSSFVIPEWAEISVTETLMGEAVKSSDGKNLFYLTYALPFRNQEPQPLAIVFYFAGWLCLLGFVHFLFAHFLNRIGWLLQFVLALAVPVTAFYLLNHFGFIPEGVANWKLFAADVFASPDIGSSLGSLFIQCVIAVWAVIYINFFVRIPVAKNGVVKIIASFLWMMLVFFIGVYFVYSIKGLSRDSKLLIGFLNPITPDYLSLIALFCLSVFAFCFYLMAQKASEYIRAVSVSLILKISVLATVTLLTVFYTPLFDFDLSPVFIAGGICVLVCIIYLLAVKNVARIDLVRLFILLIVFSVSCALLTTYFRQEKDLNTRLSLARKLINERDNVTEYLLADMRPQIESDKYIKNYFINPQFSYKEFTERLRQLYFAFGFSRYEVDFVAFNAEGLPLNVEESASANNFGNEIFRNAQTLVSGKLYYFNGKTTGSGYAAFYPILVSGNYIGRLFIVLRSKLLNRINVYPELLLEEKDKIPAEAEGYSFGIYENNHRLNESSGSIEYPVNDIYGPMTKEVNEPLIYREGKIEHIILKQDDGDTVVISKEIDLLQEFFSAFSYLFVAAFLFVVLIGFLLYLYLFSKGSAHFFSFAEASFRNIIQLSFIFIIFLSVSFLGLTIGNLFQAQFNNNTTEKLSEKLKEVEQSVRYVVTNTVSFDSLCGFTPRDLSTILNININDFSELHDMDVNFYDMHGVLLTSSQPSIFEKGLQSRMMDAKAFQLMQSTLPSEFIQQETIGKLKYLSGYKPVYNEEGQLLAYLNIPYFNTYRLLNEQIGVFFSALINILVTALILAGFLAPFISRQITGKLSHIAEKFKQVTVGGKNQPIQWQARDELAVLVNEFNKMIAKLDESAKQLARSERESAWREMAQQVAHEIKNPLTPMKLSIQHLQRAYDANDPRAAELAERVTKTLIEQIENLSQIATEFSSFAKMPQPENEELHLLEVIYHSANLYKQNEGVSVTVQTEGKINDLIFGDKNQLLRVFNNLILNSIQAIPEGREGEIIVKVFNEENKIIAGVTDNGVGISTEQMKKVFVPNFTTKSSGTGLGLAISRNIIELAGGTIRFESVENEGTTFFVMLPLYQS